MPYLQPGYSFSLGKKLHDVQGGNADGAVISVVGAPGSMSTLVLQVVCAGFTGTVNFEASLDGVTWFALSGINLTTAAAATTVTASALFRFDVRGIAQVRARTSGVVGGNVTVSYCLVA